MSEPVLPVSALTFEVPGIPGPKGSLSAFCVTCAKARRPQNVVLKEQSGPGVAFRKATVRAVKAQTPAGTGTFRGALAIDLTVYIPRQAQIKNGQPTGLWTPGTSTPYPINRNTGDIEKHARNTHDALQDAGLIADDSTIVDLTVRKRWASPTPGAPFVPGARITVTEKES